jgi:hypothetical protein
MKHRLNALALAFLVVLLAAHTPETFAQVSTGATGTKISTFLSWVLALVQVAGYSLFTIALTVLGYKSAFVEGFKLSDGKGILIGGLIFGSAGLIASYVTA